MRLVERGRLRLLVFPGLEETGLRCAVSTRPLDVKRRDHRDTLAEALGFGPRQTATVRQVHGAEVLVAGSGDRVRPGDGLLTDEPGRALLLKAADCSLVVVADPARRVVGVAHVGWRGAARGVIGVLARTMESSYGCDPGSCRAAIGPTICAGHYPVGREVVDEFRRARPWAEECVRTRDGRPHFDLAAANRRLLTECGIPETAIEVAGECTYERTDLLYSYRRDGPETAHHGLAAGWPD
ncbi:MAG: polyphenol oxidase family protein [Planctomycetota bacterium]